MNQTNHNRAVNRDYSSHSAPKQRTEPLDLTPFIADAPLGTLSHQPPPREDWYEPPTPPADPGPALRLLPKIGDVECWWKRWLFLLVALAITAGYFFFLHAYVAPAPGRSGVDENAYLVGGRNLVDHFSTGYPAPDGFAYVGLMWVQSPKNGWFYPKYSFGQSVLDAIALKIGGEAHGVEWAFLVNPMCTSLALLAIFFLVRNIAGSFWSVLAMLLLGFGYTTLARATNPDSHASTLFFVTTGIYLLMRWWETGSIWRGALAGFLLGFAVTIRYNEAMLLFPLYSLDHVLSDTAWWKGADHKGGHLRALYFLVKAVRFLPIGPIGLAVLLSIRWRRFDSYLRASVPIIAWGIPVATLVLFNLRTLGVMTGYDLTHESEGFTTGEFLSKWQFAVQQLYMFGLFLTLPLGVAGLAILFRRSWRIGLLLTLWFLPGSLLFVTYYWGNHLPGVAYLRFYLTFLPPMIAAAMWLLYTAGKITTDGTTRRGSIAVPIGAGILTAAAVGVGLMISLENLDIEHRHNTNLAYSGDAIRYAIHRTNPNHARPVAFCDEGLLPHLLEYMQFAQPGDWYSTDAFDMRFNGSFGAAGFQRLGKSKDDQSKPVLIHQQRIDAQVALFKGKTPALLIEEQHKVIRNAIAAKRPVYAVLTPSQLADWKRRFLTDGFEAKQLSHWTEPCAVPSEEEHGPLAPPGWPEFIHRGRQEFFLMQIIHPT